MIGVHVPLQMDARIDPSGHESEVVQVIVGLEVAGADGHDAAVFDDDLLIVEGSAFAVEEKTGLQDNAVLGLGQIRDERDGGEKSNGKQAHAAIVSGLLAMIPPKAAVRSPALLDGFALPPAHTPAAGVQRQARA